ncbi:MAG: DNA polymerase-3 subunit delta' [Gammaproteobacteria bacterium]|jgi:DNA polymerase-3 subunit delta'
MLKPYPWQSGQWQQILAAHSQKRLSHALLLTGPEGIGLEQFAYSLAALLLCKDKQNNVAACGSCKSCILFQAGNHPDLFDIQPDAPGKQIKVDAIRQLINYIHMKSQYAEYKMAIINPAEAMNNNAANALLKTLEEPPADSLIILLSTKSAQLPVTIRSRCQRLNFSANDDETTVVWLRSKLKDQDIDALDLLTMAQGAPLKALELLESDSLQQQQSLLNDLDTLRQRASDPVKMAEKWLAQDGTQVIMYLLNFFVIMSRLKLGASANNSTVHRHLQRMIKGLDLVQLIHCHNVLLQHYRGMTGSISLNKQGLLEDFIIHWQTTADQTRG